MGRKKRKKRHNISLAEQCGLSQEEFEERQRNQLYYERYVLSELAIEYAMRERSIQLAKQRKPERSYIR